MSAKVKAELLAIQHASRDKMLHADQVVAWAKAHKKSALHSQFEWDNSRAAREYRMWQARRLIQINIVTEDGEPQLVSLSVDRGRTGGGYRDIGDVVNSKRLSEIMLKDALAELERVRARFHRVKELTSVWEEVDRVKIRGSKRDMRQLAKAA